MNTNSIMASALRAVLIERSRYMRGGPDRYPDQLICHPTFWAKLLDSLREYGTFNFPFDDATRVTFYGMNLTVSASIPVDSFVLAKAQKDVY